MPSTCKQGDGYKVKMLNGELKGFVDFLLQIELAGKQSRMRTRFVKMVSERLSEVEDSHFQMIQKYANLLENGHPATKLNEEGITVYDIPTHNASAFDREWRELQREEFIMDETDERLDMLHTVRDAVLNVEITFSGRDALVYDRWCDIVEAIR